MTKLRLLFLLFLIVPLLAPAAATEGSASWNQTAQKQMAEGKATEAVQTLTTASHLFPADASIFKSLGQARFLSGDIPGAKQALSKSLTLNPFDAALEILLAKPANEFEPAARLALRPTPPEERNWLTPALMSAALPGAGQLYNRTPVRAFTLGVPTLAFLTGAALAYNQSQEAQRRIANTPPGYSAKSEDENARRWADQAFTCLAFNGLVLYVCTIVDAAVKTQPKLRANLESNRIQFAVVPGGFRSSLTVKEF